MIKYFLYLFLLSSIFFEALGGEKIVLKGVRLTMEELVQEATRQTGRTIHLRVRESKGRKILYDCETNLNELLEAIKGYYLIQAGIELQIKEINNVIWIETVAEEEEVEVVDNPEMAVEITEQKMTEANDQEDSIEDHLKKVRGRVKKAGKSVGKFFKNAFKLKKEEGGQFDVSKSKKDQVKSKGNDVKAFSFSDPVFRGSYHKSEIIDLQLNKKDEISLSPEKRKKRAPTINKIVKEEDNMSKGAEVIHKDVPTMSIPMTDELE